MLSPLLANIALSVLDEHFAAAWASFGQTSSSRQERRRKGLATYRLVRYADDFVVLCKTREEADAALGEIRAWVAENGLRLHPNKTHVGDCRQRGEGFEFLGYRFEAGHRFVRK